MGELPPGWAWARLGEVLPLEYGKALPHHGRDQTGTVPVYGSAGKTGLHTLSVTSNPAIIIGRKGNAGAVHYVPEPCWPIDTVYFVRSSDVVDLRFGSFLLEWLDLTRLDSSTAVPSLSRNQYSDVIAPIPPLREQERIVLEISELLEEMEAGEAALSRARDEVTRFRASLLHAATTGALTTGWRAANPPAETGADLLRRILAERRVAWECAERARLEAKGTPPRGEGWKARYVEPTTPTVAELPNIPDGWVWASLDQLTTRITSGSRDWGGHYTDHGAALIRAQNIKSDTLIVDDLAHVRPPGTNGEARTRLELHDLLITITGANVTKAACMDICLLEAYVNQHVGLCRPVQTKLTPFIHLAIVCESIGRKQLTHAAYGAGKPGLNLQDLARLTLPLPPLSEQAKVVRLVTDTLATSSLFENQSGSPLSFRQSILHAAFTGRLVPQDPADEPASVLLARLRATPAAPRPGTRRRAPEPTLL